MNSRLQGTLVAYLSAVGCHVAFIAATQQAAPPIAGLEFTAPGGVERSGERLDLWCGSREPSVATSGSLLVPFVSSARDVALLALVAVLIVALLVAVYRTGWVGLPADDAGPEEQSGPETAGEATGDRSEGSTDLPEAAVLTNAERVRQLVEANGGRMLQRDVVEATDWSKATVSRVLSEMEEAGTVTRVDVGNGNLVTLPEEDPEIAVAEFFD